MGQRPPAARSIRVLALTGLADAGGMARVEIEERRESEEAQRPEGIWLDRDWAARAGWGRESRARGALEEELGRAWAAGTRLRRTRWREARAAVLQGQRVVIKRSERDEPRDRWFARLHGLPGSVALREARCGVLLERLGLSVARPLAALAGPAGGGTFIQAWVEHEQHLGAALGSAVGERRRELLDQLGRSVARLHSAGWYHRDLYLQHWLLDPSGRLVLIDLGRARHQPRPRGRWRIKDLAALHGSAPAGVSRSERLRWLADWQAALPEKLGGLPVGCGGLERRRRRARLVRQVEQRARRLFAHRPVDEGTDRAGWPSGAG